MKKRIKSSNPHPALRVKARRQAALVAAFVKYTELLVAELRETIGLAHMHGCRSSRYKDGLKCRLEIKRCCEALGLPVPKWEYTPNVIGVSTPNDVE